MSLFDKYLLKKDNLLKRRIEIYVDLYEKLQELTKIYDASINDLVNISIMEMIENNEINIYEPNSNLREYHSFSIRESLYKQLEEIKRKYKLSITQLVNIAIYNALKKDYTN